MTAVRYTGDDGTVYQIDQPSLYSSAGAGDLPPALGSEPIFAAMWTPRFLLAYLTSDPTLPRVHVICNATNPLYTAGPGTTFNISAVGYTVERCYGESRPLI